MSEKFLAVRLGSLGDVVLSTGVLRAWYRLESAGFAYLTKSKFAPVLEGHPAIKKVITVPPYALNAPGWINFCRCLARNLGHLELIDLHSSLRTMFLKAAWPSTTHTYSKQALARRVFGLTRHPALKKKLIAADVPARYFQALDLGRPGPSDLGPCIILSPQEKTKARQVIRSVTKKRQMICLHPYATHPAKAWPAEHWIKLTALLERKGMDWIVIGQNKTGLVPADPRDLTSGTDIRLTCALLHHCRLLVTGDSGPMHLARAVGTPVLALFGPTTREWGFYPAGKKDLVLEEDLPCRPCSLHGRISNLCRAECMGRITPEKVMKGMQYILDAQLSRCHP